MASELKTISYNPLAINHIRLIKLLPGKWDDIISIEIDKAVSLADSPEYDALSYVWGQQLPSWEVRCGDAIVQVGKNLYDALQHLRDETKCLSLWIDSIAINQQDLKERGSQVKLMAQIYGSAATVLVWLGVEDDQARKAWEIFGDLFEQFSAEISSSGVPKYEISYREINIVYPAWSDEEAWAALRSILRRPWFTRVWTFQEAVVAHDILLICGSLRIPFQRVAFIINCMSLYPPGPNHEDFGIKEGALPVFRISLARIAYHHPDEVKDKLVCLGFLNLLKDFRFYKATDPRDHVYALLNVSLDVEPGEIDVDYSKTLIELCAETT